jgi:hypothetical protein
MPLTNGIVDGLAAIRNESAEDLKKFRNNFDLIDWSNGKDKKKKCRKKLEDQQTSERNI